MLGYWATGLLGYWAHIISLLLRTSYVHGEALGIHSPAATPPFSVIGRLLSPSQAKKHLEYGALCTPYITPYPHRSDLGSKPPYMHA
jgi:hypothetical protein